MFDDMFYPTDVLWQALEKAGYFSAYWKEALEASNQHIS